MKEQVYYDMIEQQQGRWWFRGHRRILKPIFETSPSHQWLYGSHDKILHHFRRYSTAALKKVVSGDMKIIKFSHFNFLFFPVLVLTRFLDMLIKHKESMGYKIPIVLLNGLLSNIISLKRYLINIVSFPFFRSALVILKINE